METMNSVEYIFIKMCEFSSMTREISSDGRKKNMLWYSKMELSLKNGIL